MNTRRFHQTNMGSFAPEHHADRQGYITIHDSPRYESAAEEELEEWAESRFAAVRAAADTEIAERRLSEWQES